MTTPVKEQERILLIGGSGYLGTEVSRLLLSNNIFVANYDVKESPVNGVLSITKPVYNDTISRFNTIVYMATNFEYGDDISGFNQLVNMCTTAHKYIVYISSCGVNNVSDRTKYIESKRQCEMLLMKTASQWSILRPASIYGWSIPMNWVSLPNAMVWQAMNKEKLITVMHENEYRPLIHVHDIAKAVLHLANQRGLHYERVYNLASDNFTKTQIAIAIQTQVKGCTIDYKGDPKRTGYEVSRNGLRSLRILNWKTLDYGIKEIIDAEILQCS